MTVLESDAEIVFWEIVCYYCPNCLFEVPTASVKAEKNRCARNCFECPICLNTLSVISSVDPEKEPSPPTWADRASSTPNSLHSPGLSAGNVHYLLCGLCRWDSLEINLKFDRPTGLAIQLQKTEDDRDDVKEFENLRDHFEQIFRSNATGAHSSSLRNSGLNISSSLLASIPSLASLSSYSSKRSSNFSSSSKETINTYKSLIDSSEIVDEDSNLHYEDVSNLLQRYRQIHDQPKSKKNLKLQRIQLRTKRSKRCRHCEHQLIKPEPKTHLTKFKIKQMARDVIPTIIIAQPFTELPLTPLKTIVIVLKFTNPSEEQMEISLFTPFSKNLTEKTEVDTNVTAFNNLDTENQSCEVTLLAKDFTVEKYSEFLEFDQSSLASLNTNDLLTEGVLEKKFNTTSVLVDIKPIKMKMKNKKNTLSTSEAINNIEHEKQVVEFPLLVTFPRKSEENGEVSEESFWVIVSVGYLDNNFIAEATNK